jgi:lipoyl(octanoyl) transferase
MEERAAAIREGQAPELIWLMEHPPLYTAGVSAAASDLLDPTRFPVHLSGRGGKHTYHGPGQRVVYLLLDLDQRGRDLRRFVAGIERWVADALFDLGVSARSVPGRTGVWVEDAKIAAIGIRVRRWVSYHGVAINVAPDLTHFAGIVPCGLAAPVTSLAALGRTNGMDDLDAALARRLPDFLTGLADGKLNEGFTATANAPERCTAA